MVCCMTSILSSLYYYIPTFIHFSCVYDYDVNNLPFKYLKAYFSEFLLFTSVRKTQFFPIFNIIILNLISTSKSSLPFYKQDKGGVVSSGCLQQNKSVTETQRGKLSKGGLFFKITPLLTNHLLPCKKSMEMASNSLTFNYIRIFWSFKAIIYFRNS